MPNTSNLLFSRELRSFSFQTDFLSPKHQPFWLKSNRWGLNSAKMRHRIFIDYNLQNFNTKIEVVNYANKIGLIEGNISLTQKNFLLTLGMNKKPLGELNHSLSSGSLISSANAVPLPKITIENNHPIQLQLNNYTLNIAGGVSHGLMSDNSYLTNPYLHEKWGYLKIINDQFQFHFGLIHEAIWGGRTKEHGDLPKSLSDFVKVFL